MKKIWLIAFFFLTFLSAGSPEDFKINTSIKFSSEIFNASFNCENQKIFYGLNLTLESFSNKLPINIGIGNLSISGFSKLKNPSLSSTIVPCTIPSITINKIKTSIPGLTGSSKPLSIVSDYHFKDKKYILNQFDVTFLYDVDNTSFYSSLTANIKQKKYYDFGINVLSGFFPVNNNTQTIWYSELPFYNGFGESFRTQLLFNFYPASSDIKHFSNEFSTNFYYNSSSGFSFSLEDSIILKLRRINFYNQIFYNGFSKTYSDYNKTIEGLFQDKCGITLTKLTFISENPFILTYGCSLFNSWNYNSEELTSKQGIGFKLTGSDLFINSTFTIIEKYVLEKFYIDSLSLNCKQSINLNNVKLSSGIGFTIEPDKTFSNFTTIEKINFGFNFSNYLNNSNSVSFYQNNGELTKINLNTSLSSSIKLKKISCTGKISAAFNFTDF